jgi:hypothetical protein
MPSTMLELHFLTWSCKNLDAYKSQLCIYFPTIPVNFHSKLNSPFNERNPAKEAYFQLYYILELNYKSETK